MVFLAMKSATNQLATVERVCTATGRKQCWFYPTFFFGGGGGGGGGGGVLRCFGVFWTISSIVFKADILSTDYFFERQVSFVNPTLSVSAAATAPIGYRIRVLEAIGAAEHNEPGLCAP